MLETQNYDIFQESSKGNNLYLAIFEREDNPEKIIAKNSMVIRQATYFFEAFSL